MTKNEIVEAVLDANTELVFTLASTELPWLRLPLVAWIVKYYLKKWFRPAVSEGTVFVAFKVIDWGQLERAKDFSVALQNLKEAEKNGIPDEIKKQADAFDEAFRRAVSLRS